MLSHGEVAILATLGSGLATGLGALPIFLMRTFPKDFLSGAMGFSAGIMLVASFVSLIFPGLEFSAISIPAPFDFATVIVGLVCGYAAIIALHDRVPHSHMYKEDDVKSSGLSRMMLVVLAIALHNLPEGLAVGVGFGSGDMDLGLGIATAIAIQNIPEGLIVAFGLISEGRPKRFAFGMAWLSGAVEPVAALLGYLWVAFAAATLPFTLGFAGGAMLFVVCQEVFPELFKEGQERPATLGVVVGIVSMLAIDRFMN